MHAALAVARSRARHVQAICPARQGSMIWHWELQAKQAKDRPDQNLPFDAARAERQPGVSAPSEWPAVNTRVGPAGPGFSAPGCNRCIGEPQRHYALAQARFIGRPVRQFALVWD